MDAAEPASARYASRHTGLLTRRYGGGREARPRAAACGCRCKGSRTHSRPRAGTPAPCVG